MIERRQYDRRTGGPGTGRRSTDRRPAPVSHRRAAAGEVPQRLVIVGAEGATGAKMARFVKLWAGDYVDVTLIEPGFASATFPASGEECRGDDLATFDRRALSSRYGVRVIGKPVSAIDTRRRAVTLSDGTHLTFDRLELAPGAESRIPS